MYIGLGTLILIIILLILIFCTRKVRHRRAFFVGGLRSAGNAVSERRSRWPRTKHTRS